MRIRVRRRRAIYLLPLALFLAAFLGTTIARGSTAATAVGTSHFGALSSLVPAGVARASVVTLTTLHFNGNPPDDAGCTGVGPTDVSSATCSDLRAMPTLSTATAAQWPPVPGLSQNIDRSTVDPNWIWVLTAPVTIQGDMRINWWASVNATAIAFGMAWDFELWADGALVFSTETAAPMGIDVTPSTPNVPELLGLTLTVPQITATTKLVLKIDPHYLDTGTGSVIYYDSSVACPGAAMGSGPCDSTVILPVVTPTPTAVRITGLAASTTAAGVSVRWRTASETNLVGFNLWRQGAGALTRINKAIIAARGSAAGASYRALDRSARSGVSYRYRLQAVYRDGTRSWLRSTKVRVSR